jgi:uncharacterized protein Yka (UPF0111/DUF47 family)
MIKGAGMGLREWIIPQDRIFFDLFESLSSVVVRASEELVALVENYQDVKLVAQRIKGIEHEGDEITHRIFEQLNTTFITPLDSQEISRLASALDDVLDYIDGSTRRMHNYGLTETDAHMIELAKLIRLSATELAEAVKQIRTIKDPRRIEERCIEVNRLENIADDVLAHAITDLFKTDDAITIIKLKDIYDYLEIATDKCEDAANVLSDIAIRHS